MKKQIINYIIVFILVLFYNFTLKANPIITADFTYSYITSDILQFNDQSTTNPGYSIVQWNWDFGDGGIDSLQNPFYQYYGSGNYNVCLTVVADSAGFQISDTICMTVAVTTVTIVTADFSYSFITCDSIAFTDLSTCSSGYNIVQWNWDFGDGNTSYLMNPAHQYNANGTYTVSLVVYADSAGIVYNDTTFQSLVISSSPDVSFTWNPEPTPIGQTTNFYGASNSQVVSWLWDFGDGNSSSVQNPVHTFSNVGTYIVSLQIVDTGGCQNSVYHNCTVTDLPILDFTWDQSCLNNPVQFTVLSPPTDTGAIASYFWDLGDGNSSTMQNPSHLYVQVGNYNVTLTITDTLNAVNSLTKTITIYDSPVSYFIVDDSSCVGAETMFVDSSYIASDSISQWDWDFGDGNTQTILYPDNPDVTHIYDSTGTFTVTLQVTSDNSCSNISQQEITISQSPVADFNYETNCPEDPVLFTDLSTENGGTDIVTWFWDFGDTLSGSNNTSTQQNPTHIFSSYGDFSVELEVTNATGCSNSTVSILPIYQTPVDFTYNNDCIYSPIQFEVDETITNVSEVISWHWDFGDGDTSTLQNPTHAYQTSGGFNVVLTIETINGCTAEALHIINIYELPVVDIYPSGAYVVQNDSIQFQSLSSDSLFQWTWDFGDGGVSNLANPVHAYSSLGTYSVALEVIDINNCIGSDNDVVNVIPLPYFPDSNAIWNTIGYNSLSLQDWRFRYGLIGDTILNLSSRDTSFTYSKVYNLWDTTLTHPNSTYFGAVRNDNGKVFLKLPDLTETILYDFTAEVGDTIWFNLGGAACYNDIVLEEKEHFKIVSLIDSVLLLDELYHKQLHLEGESINDIWIQGLGSAEWVGFLNPLIVDYTLCGDSYSFACLKENESYLFIDNPECELCFCYLLTDISEITNNKKEVVIYPVPANDILTINIPDSQVQHSELIVYGTMGNKVYNNAITAKESITINTSKWKPGIYSVVLADNNEIIAKGKILISR